MVIIFDLDDTLYEEMTYVQSGFQAVASYLSPLLNLGVDSIIKGLNVEFRIQRDKIFDRFLKKQGHDSRHLVGKCVSIYRGHPPQIQLFPEARVCLERLQNFPLYVVTDGNQRVQRRKFFALGLNAYIRKCVCTYAYGVHNSKPSPYCFQKICQWEKVNPSCVVYIADNPHKDFIGIKSLGFHTIRVLTGPYRTVTVPPAAEAEQVIHNLSEVYGYL